MSSYETAIARMNALGHELAQTPSHKFDLAHMRVLLAALDNPERRFPSVLIAGTNGKVVERTLSPHRSDATWAWRPRRPGSIFGASVRYGQLAHGTEVS